MKILIVGDPFSVSGYSLYCRELMLALMKAGHDIYLLHGQQDQYQNHNFSGAKLIEECADKYAKLKAKKFDAVLRVSIPLSWNKESDADIGVFCYEADQLPKSFIDKCNMMDGIITSSTFCQEVFKNSGITVPVEIAPWFVEPPRFANQSKDLGLPDFGKDFVFLSAFQWGGRKGWDLLLRAYWAEFGPDEPVTLVIKTYGGDFSRQSTQRIINEIQTLKQALWIVSDNHQLFPTPKVHLITDPLSDIQMSTLYHKADCFVLPTCGEGIGRIFLEATSHNLSIITTDWSGHTDFLNKENAHMLEYTLEPCIGMNGHPQVGGFYPITANMARPSINDLKKKMRGVFEKSISLDRPVLINEYTDINMAEKTIEAIKRIKANHKTKVEIV
jgi:glycosyltransferase involved in cell wall biosynthesis